MTRIDVVQVRYFIGGRCLESERGNRSWCGKVIRQTGLVKIYFLFTRDRQLLGPQHHKQDDIPMCDDDDVLPGILLPDAGDKLLRSGEDG